jgi:taurine dioxygenase
MDDRPAIALLDEIKAHATRPEFCHRPAYRPGDVVIWDNCSLLHSAPLIDPNEPRTLWRITVKERGPTL